MGDCLASLTWAGRHFTHYLDCHPSLPSGEHTHTHTRWVAFPRERSPLGGGQDAACIPTHPPAPAICSVQADSPGPRLKGGSLPTYITCHHFLHGAQPAPLFPILLLNIFPQGMD